MSSESPSSFRPIYDLPECSLEEKALAECAFEREQMDFDNLIANGSLGVFVRSNNQSRAFQIFLSEATPEQIELIVTTLYMELPELVTHEYANYMIQKLFTVCGESLRLAILEKLEDEITSIARNKQGTHTLQTLITLFTSSQEYELVAGAIREHFSQLSAHPNATHFVQKVVAGFPYEQIADLFPLAEQAVVGFATDKNAMCVLKQFLHRAKALSDSQQHLAPGQGLVAAVTLNVDRIIQDAYGNYIVQFCYELFGAQNCQGITSLILEKFKQFSLQKYSSSVLLKCLSAFWHNSETIGRLGAAISSEGITEMFRNREGNRILLEIVERHEDSPVAHKIHKQLANEPPKHFQDRWNALGNHNAPSRTALSGSSAKSQEWGSFSEAARRPIRNKRRQRNLH